MSGSLQVLDPDAPIFTISVAAQLAGMHPQTLRTYDRLGLVVPKRARGGRRYSPRNVNQLRLIQRLSQDEGINLNGIREILNLHEQLERSQERVAQLTELMHHMVRRQQETSGGRVFTAGSHGDVQPGRRRTALPALTAY